MRRQQIVFIIGFFGIALHLFLIVIKRDYTDTFFNGIMILICLIMFVINGIRDFGLLTAKQKLLCSLLVCISVVMGVEIISFATTLGFVFLICSGVLLYTSLILEAMFIDKSKTNA